ncbi:MAG TPA: EAL domain-containing protein [Steroidobacteraceae bacterium]
MAQRVRFAGLGTRVAARTFALFCLCAIVPIVISATFADRIVRAKLRDDAARQLASTSKSYGLLVFERLRQTEEALADLATLGMAERLSQDDIRAYKSSHFRVVDVSDGATRASALSLQGTEVRLTVFRQSGAHSVQITAALDDSYLWSADAVYLDGMQLCVYGPNAQVLHCVGEAVAPAPDDDVERRLTGDWTLFLASHYRAPSWLVRTEQPAAVALSALFSFERTLPVVTLIAITLALLLSVVQIRRSHRPLALLTHAVERMGRRGLQRVVRIDTDDEYGDLGHAFNRMATGLARQFELFRTLARIDRMILDDPSTDALVQKILPTLPKLLQAPLVAVATASRETGKIALWWSSSATATVGSRQSDELRIEQLLGKGDFEAPDLAAIGGHGARQVRYGLPIEVDGRLRGALLLADPDSRGSSTRHARAFARRFAVALGSEERRDSLLRQAYYDDLTGLPNRQLFKDRLERELAHARRSHRQVALIYIDLDRFKTVNDSMGHSAGDELLLAVSRRLAGQVRESDTLARLGGDEFVMIAPGPNEQPAHVVAERVQAALREPIAVQDANCFVQASIGLAVYPQDGADPEALLRSADIAMYRAKSAGRGGVMYFEETMNRDAQRRLLVEQRLRVALSAQMLELAYQPKVNLQDGSLAGVEALARWRDPQLGVVSPIEFIAVAEECGLIDELGTWVLHEACWTYQGLRRQGIELGHVSVNVSMRQLRDERFVAEVRQALERTGMRAHALEIEVTESTLADNPREVNARLDAIRQMGVRISIDDFGTGYSSMSALSALPTDALKIDRSFVTDCAGQATARSVVEAIVSIAHVLGKVTVAEGVETADHVRTLRELGCDFAQGYLFSKPVPRHQLAAVAAQVGVWGDIVNAPAEREPIASLAGRR